MAKGIRCILEMAASALGTTIRYIKHLLQLLERKVARVTGLEPATSGVTGRHSNQLSYTRALSYRTICPA